MVGLEEKRRKGRQDSREGRRMKEVGTRGRGGGHGVHSDRKGDVETR